MAANCEAGMPASRQGWSDHLAEAIAAAGAPCSDDRIARLGRAAIAMRLAAERADEGPEVEEACEREEQNWRALAASPGASLHDVQIKLGIVLRWAADRADREGIAMFRLLVSAAADLVHLDRGPIDLPRFAGAGAGGGRV